MNKDRSRRSVEIWRHADMKPPTIKIYRLRTREGEFQPYRSQLHQYENVSKASMQRMMDALQAHQQVGRSAKIATAWWSDGKSLMLDIDIEGKLEADPYQEKAQELLDAMQSRDPQAVADHIFDWLANAQPIGGSNG